MGGGRSSSLESLRRAGRMLFFLVNMLGSLFVSCGPLLVSILDIAIVFSAFTCCSSCFAFRADWATYSFRGSLVDIPLLSLGRSFIALCVYAVCGVPSLCHGPYLGVTIVSGIGTAVMLSVKACLHANFKRGLPLLLIASAVFALAHIVVAYKARCRARRKLFFDRSDGASSLMIFMGGYQRVPGSTSPTFLRRNDLESNMLAKGWDDSS